MSILLFHPNAKFDFHRKFAKSKKLQKTLLIIFFAVLVFGSLLGFGHYKVVMARRERVQVADQTSIASTLTPSPDIPKQLPQNPAGDFSATVPILLYHYTPQDFEQQLQHLQSHGYTAISMYELTQFLYTASPLPAKPVVITFDDGFLDQERAFELLKKYQMKATFYLIWGGSESNFCLGLTKTSQNCGDSYLNIDSIKTMAKTGLIEIGAHSLNHPNLVALPDYKAWQEIKESKNQLEATFQVSVTGFAYPYGIYNQKIAEETQRAGFLTAVTTRGGESQTTSGRYTIPRVRNAMLLP